MTKQLCKNCKHLETDGMFGIFCGVGGDNTKYDCPKYDEKVRRMTEKEFTKIYNTNEVIIDCTYCNFHNYGSFDDDDFEICEKGHEIYPNDCDDFERTKLKKM